MSPDGPDIIAIGKDDGTVPSPADLNMSVGAWRNRLCFPIEINDLPLFQ